MTNTRCTGPYTVGTCCDRVDVNVNACGDIDDRIWTGHVHGPPGTSWTCALAPDLGTGARAGDGACVGIRGGTGAHTTTGTCGDYAGLLADCAIASGFIVMS